MNCILIIISAIIFFHAAHAHANPTVSGSTGLITVPTADTLPPGNACLGLWGDIASGENQQAVTMPFGVTIGLGASWEVYGSYPNLLFNDDEFIFNSGVAEIGTKFRVKGKATSDLKVAVDLFGQRELSNSADKKGATNYGGRVIGSYLTESLGLHLNSGYKINGSKDLDNELQYGAGVDFFPTPRSKLIFELFGSTGSTSSDGTPVRATAGIQYYLSPHLTLNLAGSVAVAGGGPDWRATAGFSTCQGVGTYVKPITHVPRPGEKVGEQVVKPVKVIALTPLLLNAAAPAAPVSKLEVQVEPDQEEIYVKPSAQVIIPAPPTHAAVSGPKPAREKPAVPVEPAKAPVSEASLAKPVKEVVGVIPAEPDMEILKEGESPLYGIEVKGEKLSVAVDVSPKKGEKMLVYRKYRFPDVTYQYNQTELTEDVKKSLSEVADLLRADKKWASIRIDAHTDGVGSGNYNMDLSLQRAITIATYLSVNEGIDSSRIFIKGMGKSKQIADNATTTGRKSNRRFEILLLTPAAEKTL